MNLDLRALEKDKIKAINQNQWKEAAAACNCIGMELERMGQFENALESHKEELRYHEITDDKVGVGIANRRIGECYSLMNQFDKAFGHIKLFLETAVSIGDKLEEQRAWATLGRTYFLKQSFEVEEGASKSQIHKTLEKAEHAYINALELTEAMKDQLNSKEFSEMKARVLLNLGLVYDARGDISQCAEYMREAIFLASKFDLYEVLHRCQTSLASVYQRHGKLSYALSCLEKGIESAEKLRDKTLLCDALYSKALILVALKDFQGGKNLLKKAYKMPPPVEEDHQKVCQGLKICVGLCNAQASLQDLDIDDKQEKKILLERIADGLSSLGIYKLAIEYYLLTLQHMEDNGFTPTEKAPIYFSIAVTYRDDGNLPKALEYLRLELKCQENRPIEKIKSLWKMAEYLQEMKDVSKEEEILLHALFVADQKREQPLLASSLQKLSAFYERNKMEEKCSEMEKRLEKLDLQVLSDESEIEEETQDFFGDIRLSELSDLSDKESEQGGLRSRRTRKPVQKVNEKGESALHQACINGNFTVVRRLVESGSDVNVRDNCGWTPLHEACNHGFYDIAEYLIDNGANVHDRGGELCDGITPLHDAANCGCIDVMKLLISRGASVTVCNNLGETPLQSLVEWKERTEMEDGRGLDPEMLGQYLKMVERLKTLMAQAGQPPSSEIFSKVGSHQQSDVDLQGIIKASEKRARSDCSSDSNSEDECTAIVPYMSQREETNWDDDANLAQSEYKSVMTSLRKSGQSVVPEKKPATMHQPKEALIKESDYVDEWLIKDTNQPQRPQKKRRKMRRLNVRTSKCIDNYLTTSDVCPPSPVGSSSSDVININEDFNEVEPMAVSVFNPVTREVQGQGSKNITLKVRIEDKLILVPVPDDTCLVSWLAKEAAERYQELVGSKLHLTLMTKEGALLSSHDPVMKLFSNNEEVLTSIECFEEPSLVERYEKTCDKRQIKPLNFLKGYLKPFDTCKKLNFSGVPVPKVQIALIFTALSQFRNLQSLDIGETVIGDDSSHHIINCFPSFVSLVSLNMRCCGLSAKSLKGIADCIQSRNSVILPNLKELNLSYNKFDTNCGSHLSILLTLPSLTVLNISCCDLSPSVFLDKPLCLALKACANLEQLDISRNVLYGSCIEAYLKHLPKQNLRRLDLSHVGMENAEFGNLLCDFFAEGLPFLENLSLQECHLKSSDLVLFQSSLFHCPELASINLSSNPDLTAWDVSRFLQSLLSHSSVTDVAAVQTCEWDDSNVRFLSELFKKKNLQKISLDRLTEPLQDALVRSWENTWGIQAKSLTMGFCELRIL